LRIVVGLVVPPRTVGSLAITRHCVRATSARATTTPPRPGRRCAARRGAQLEHGRAGVDQCLQALAHEQFAAGPVTLHVLRTAAGEDVVVQGAHLVDQRAHGGGVVPELVSCHGQA